MRKHCNAPTLRHDIPGCEHAPSSTSAKEMPYGIREPRQQILELQRVVHIVDRDLNCVRFRTRWHILRHIPPVSPNIHLASCRPDNPYDLSTRANPCSHPIGESLSLLAGCSNLDHKLGHETD